MKDSSKYLPYMYGEEQLYISIMSSSDELVYMYDIYGRLRVIQALLDTPIDDLVHGMTVVGFVFIEKDDGYAFPVVLFNKYYQIKIYILKSGYIIYDVIYEK